MIDYQFVTFNLLTYFYSDFTLMCRTIYCLVSSLSSNTHLWIVCEHFNLHVNFWPIDLIKFSAQRLNFPWKFSCLVYSVLVSVSCPKALYHLESDNLFRITVVVADWLGWNPYHRSSFCTVSDWIILKFRLICHWNFLSTLLEWRNSKLIRRYFQRRAFVGSK